MKIKSAKELRKLAEELPARRLEDEQQYIMMMLERAGLAGDKKLRIDLPIENLEKHKDNLEDMGFKVENDGNGLTIDWSKA